MKRRYLLAWLAFCAFAPAVFGGVEQTVNDLIPKLASPKVEDRFAPQMELQSLAANASRPGAEAERAELAKVLAAKAADTAVPQPARVWIVRQLEYIGSAESVGVLTALLGGQDAELKECARRALEKNSAPAASESLRAALEKGGDTAWRIGLIQSLGQRGDAKSVYLIKPCLKSKDTGPAAASALGKIATDDALTALWTAYAEGAPGAADALVTAGNRLLSSGVLKTSAKDLFKHLYLAGTPQGGATPQAMKEPAAPAPVRSAALIGWATADPDSARPFITAALEQKEPALQFAAVTAAAAAFGNPGVSAALAPLLPRLSSTAKTYTLRVLDASAEKEIIAAASDPDEVVQLTALERLGQVGSAASIPVLFQAATAGPPNTEKAAAAALARISGPGAGDAISKLAAEGTPKSRAVAIHALAQRNDQSVAPALLQYAGEADPEVSRAACSALATLGTDNDLDGLIRLALEGKTPGADAALQAVASRAKDKSAAAQKLIAHTRAAEPQQLTPLLEVLAMLGGQEALAAVSSFAASSKEEVKDAAVRALANWPDFSATKALLVIALDPNSTRVHNVLAVQAVARLVKSGDKEAAAARLEAAQAAMNAAKRPEDKKLLLSAFASVPDAKAAEAIQTFLSDPSMKSEAGLAGVTLAQALLKTDKPAARSLAQAIKDAKVSDEVTRDAEAVLTKR